MSQNILDYLDNKIEQLDFAGDINLNWDQEIRSFELEITMTGQTNNLEIEDQEGTDQSEEVEYNDAILIYDQSRVDGQEYAENYLAIVPFKGRSGLAKATIDGLFTYLAQLLDDGMNDFLDFLDPELNIEVFQLNWNQADFQAAVAKAILTDHDELVTYPKY